MRMGIGVREGVWGKKTRGEKKEKGEIGNYEKNLYFYPQ